MSTKIIPSVYATRLGNLTAKSVLALLADQVNSDGLGWPSLETICEWTEVDVRTVRRMIQVFEAMGLLARCEATNQYGRPVKALQLNLEMLGGDLRAAFALAYKAAARKKAVAETVRKTVAETAETVAETAKTVAETAKTVAETVPPHPLKGGPVSDPVLPLPPNPPLAGGVCEEFNTGQLEHLAELRTKGRNLDALMFEDFYRDQNRKALEASEREDAKAKRQQELRLALPDELSASAWVMQECAFVRDGRKRGLESVIRGVLAQELARGRPLWETAPAMAAAWRDYDAMADVLAVQYGALNFYKLGVWQRRNSWRADEKKRARQQASVGSAA